MSPLFSQVKGHANAELWLSEPVIKKGSPTLIPAAIRMVYEKGWHGYWVNPGEGGMKTEVNWKLPAGVSAGEVMFPAPKREMTGDLACYGYTGEVLLPVMLTMNESQQGNLPIAATINWLACNETGCVAGEATVKAELSELATVDQQRALAIQQAFDRLPRSDPGMRLDVKEADGWVELVFSGVDVSALEGAEVFPITEQALDPRDPIVCQKSSDGLKARVKKNEYARGLLTDLMVVVAPRNSGKPLKIGWKK